MDSTPVGTLNISYDASNEQVIIVAACFDADIRKGLTQRIRPEVFVIDKHRAIWDALRELSRKDLDYDPMTVHQISGGKADVEYLKQLCASTTAIPPNLSHHTRLLLWDRARVDCASGPLTDFLKLFKDPLTQASRLKSACKAVYLALDSSSIEHKALDPQILKDASNALLEAMRKASWPYNMPGLDLYENGYRRLNPGAQPGMTTIVTAVSGSGKSLFMMHLALAQGPGFRRAGIKGLGRKVLYGAWEMPPDMVLNLMACLSLGIERDKMFAGMLSEDEHRWLDAEKDYIQGWIKFKDQPKVKAGPTQNQLAMDSIYGTVADNAIEVGFFDLWERAFSFRSEAEEREFLIKQQELGKELHIHQILAAQQRLKVVEMQQGQDKLPSRGTTKGSSAWVDIADTMVAPNMPALWKNVPNDTFELAILKQRYGKWPLMTAAPYDETTGFIGTFGTVDVRRAEVRPIDDFLGGYK